MNASAPIPTPGLRLAMTTQFHAGPGAVDRTLEEILWAESIGYHDVWLADAGGVDALTLAALVLDRTERMRVGIAVVPAYTRTPAVLAATVATLADIAPGRFALGLGSSSETMINDWHGLPFEKPLTRLGETVTLLRQMLAGEKTAFAGETLRSHGYRQPAPASDVPIFLAALRPRMLALAAGAADGVILNLFPLRALELIMAAIRLAAEQAARPDGPPEIASRLQVVVTDDLVAGYDAFRFRFAPYYANPVYNRFLAWAGFEAEAAAILEAGAAADWKRARAAMTDELVDEVAIIGSREHCQRRLRRLAQAGIRTPILFCLSEDPDVQRETFTALTPTALEAAA